MKRILGAILILSGCLAVMPAYAQEKLTVKWNDPSRPGLLKIDWRNGSIRVKTHSTGDVTIEAARGLNPRRDPPAAGGLRRIDSPGSGIVVDSDANNVMTITSQNGMIGGNLEIEVPVKTNLNLQSHNGTTVSVDGVEGDIEATNHNGTVNVLNAAGSVVAYSRNGKVVVSLRDISAGKPMSFTSMNGAVDVTLPASSKANLKMRTDNGGIWTNFDLQLKPSTVTTQDQSGRSRIEVGKTINGTINGGGADFDLRSRNGNIYLRKAQ